jgi:hypothetical protein
MKICWIIFLVNSVSENDPDRVNRGFYAVLAGSTKFILAFLVSVFAFTSHFIATKLDTIYRTPDFMVTNCKI